MGLEDNGMLNSESESNDFIKAIDIIVGLTVGTTAVLGFEYFKDHFDSIRTMPDGLRYITLDLQAFILGTIIGTGISYKIRKWV